MKAQLKDRRMNIQSAITFAKKGILQAEKVEDFSRARKLESEIERLVSQKSFYAVSKYEPVQFANGFVLNGKLLKQFIKKLPAMNLEADFTDERTLEIKHKNGKLTLLDLQEFYIGFIMPKGEELLDELGISLG